MKAGTEANAAFDAINIVRIFGKDGEFFHKLSLGEMQKRHPLWFELKKTLSSAYGKTSTI